MGLEMKECNISAWHSAAWIGGGHNAEEKRMGYRYGIIRRMEKNCL